MSKRVGIFAGSFDPVHKGHVAFALTALKVAKLDQVYFLPEIKPRRKESVTHISHRVGMLQRALKPYPQLAVLELPDKQFSVAKTGPRLQKRFGDSELFLLIGADVLEYIPSWPLTEQLLGTYGLIAAQRGKTQEEVKSMIKALPQAPQGLYLLGSREADISSSTIRQAVAKAKIPEGLLPSVQKYIAANWLYSVAPNNS